MKGKLIIILALSAFLALGIAVAVYAACTTNVTGPLTYSLKAPTSGGATNTGIAIKPSNHVIVWVNAGLLGYAVQSCHESGDKAFGTASNSTSFFFTGIGVNACTTSYAAPSATDSGSFGTNWMSL